jgi:hypothetical protein
VDTFAREGHIDFSLLKEYRIEQWILGNLDASSEGVRESCSLLTIQLIKLEL